MPDVYLALRAKETSEASARQEEEKRIEREQLQKLLELAKLFGIEGPQSARFWYELALALAVETVDGFKVVDMGAAIGPGRPPRWSTTECHVLVKYVDVIMEQDGISIVAALKELRKLSSDRYAKIPLKTLENRYYACRSRLQRD